MYNRLSLAERELTVSCLLFPSSSFEGKSRLWTTSPSLTLVWAPVVARSERRERRERASVGGVAMSGGGD